MLTSCTGISGRPIMKPAASFTLRAVMLLNRRRRKRGVVSSTGQGFVSVIFFSPRAPDA